MAQVTTTVRMDSELKKQLAHLCQEFGMSINTAFNIFAKAVVRTQSIPFDIEIDYPEAKDDGEAAFMELRQEALALPEMTLEEINQEIAHYRASIK